MADKKVGDGFNLIVIRHPEVGGETQGIEVCYKIRAALVQSPGPAIFLHDASNLRHVDAVYVEAFRKLDDCMPGRVVEFVCLAPEAGPRLTAHLLSMFSNKHWSIFRDRKDAMVYLASKGVPVEDAVIAPPDAVSVKHFAA